MKRAGYLFFLFNLIATGLSAQQKPQYTQYIQNMSVLNPAVTGMYHNRDVRLGYRTQWVGLESAPKTSYFTISAPINVGKSSSGFVDYGVTDPSTKDDKLDYYSSLSHHGIGLVMIKDQTGPLTRTTFNFAYAFHINISDVANLALGVGGGFNRLLLNTSKLRFEDPNEPVIADGGNISSWAPDLNAGVYFYSAAFFIGGSVQQALNQKISFETDFDKGREVPHYFLTSGYRIWIKNDFSVAPSVMLKLIDPVPLSYDTNLKIAYRNNIWIGGSFRKDDSFSLLFGLNIAKMTSLSYSFDHTTSSLKNVSSGNHEIALAVNF